MMKDEKQWLASMRRGDPRALHRLIDDYSPKLYNVALRILRHPQDAEDAVQDALLAAIRKIDQFDGRSSLPTWLYRIAVNASLMALRKRGARRRREEPFEVPRYEDLHSRELADWGADPVHKVLTAEMRQVMEQAIDHLPEKYRVVFVLRDLEGLSTEETSRMLRLTPANVKIRLMRARLFLRERLDSYFHGRKSRRVKT
jgi:RNA polymerase sigma-70 factor (ECF subfamily)